MATFLTRGDLWISWEQGKNVFEHLLLDFEPAVSCGCWMKSSCTAFVTGPVEHYCPITYGKKLDPRGSYIRKYIPELQNYPGKTSCCSASGLRLLEFCYVVHLKKKKCCFTFNFFCMFSSLQMNISSLLGRRH